MEERKEEEAGAREIAGFWSRLGALAVDAIAIGLVGAILGALLFDPLARLGVYARLIGFTLALTYFGIGNSRVTRGQTLGKRLLGVRVVDTGGGFLSLPRSLVRYTVLGTPFFLNGLLLDPQHVESPLAYLLGLVVFGGTSAIVYLYLFNRRTRQSLHDLVVNSYVVRAGAVARAASFPRLWPGHLVVVAALAAIALSMPLLLQRFMGKQDWADLIAVHEAVSGQPHVMSVHVARGWTASKGKETHFLQSLLWLDAPLTDDEAFAKRMARLMASAGSKPVTDETIVVTLAYGYDMGIASAWNTRPYSFAPGDLK